MRLNKKIDEIKRYVLNLRQVIKLKYIHLMGLTKQDLIDFLSVFPDIESKVLVIEAMADFELTIDGLIGTGF